MTAFSYLRRSAPRTLQLLQSRPTCVRKCLQVFSRNESSFVPKRVLLVSKLSRYYFEKLREPNLSESELKVKLIERGSDYDEMLASHNQCRNVENEIIRTLSNLNIEYKIIDRRKLNVNYFTWADLVIPIGGDGTFLLSSNMIFDNVKPIIGINSNPEKSEGYLLLDPKYTTAIPEIFKMLKAGQYKIMMRRRVRTTLKGEGIWQPPFHMHEKGRVAGADKFYANDELTAQENYSENIPHERRLPWLALNEVFIAETLSARTSALSIQRGDEKKFHRIKCSGLCVGTGTGSTSWYKSINSVTPTTVETILNCVTTKKQYSEQEIDKICYTFNSSLKYDPEDPRLFYVIRDMIVTDKWPVAKCVYPRGFCKTLKVKSQCFDACLVIDGGIGVPFQLGATAILENYPEDSLRCLMLPE